MQTNAVTAYAELGNVYEGSELTVSVVAIKTQSLQNI